MKKKKKKKNDLFIPILIGIIIIIIVAISTGDNYISKIGKCNNIKGHICTKYEIDKLNLESKGE